MSDVLLDIRGLSTHLQSAGRLVKAVDDISFTLRKGETFCLVGESGSGKSVTALSVMRLLPETIASHPNGEIIFQGQNILALTETEMQAVRGSRIAMIFQEPMSSLNPVMTIGEQITEALLLHEPELTLEQAEQKALTALTQVQIPNPEQRLRTYPHQLSGGQRQRVMIAMALACEPDLLIADEPTTALDVTVQAEILKLLQSLQRDLGMSMLFITHDFGVVSAMAHSIGVMRYGKLVEVGTCSDVLRAPKHAYTQALLNSLPENLAKPTQVVTVPNDAKASTQPLIDIEHLNVWFPIQKGLFRRTVDYVRAVDDVSLAIYPGQILALVGESGCGKTTLGRALLQLEKPTSGNIRLKNQLLTGLSGRALRPLRKYMQIAFQDPQSSLNPRLLIATTLTEPMKVHGIGENQQQRLELAAELLTSVQLSPDHLWRYPHEFSGGQRQRIGLARALCLNPEFIVCDEITSALDVSVQAEILELLLTIRAQRHLTLLFITHNIGVVEYLSDWTVVMHKGKIVEQGPTATVCQSPKESYTAALLSAVPRLKAFM
ncbi:ABC transporter ATP-binding protein [Methylocucumis oryzae]|uniref:ABC transporter ATP-binding protein n=1 Tax=Methylocucumis oryzae TaxID=1632867 RepID=A0A0F3IKR5_9GAMM|nr:dipeptide ABC transporter ATP-binding protein [Methylocucumis oryzae]KJV07311.1 ABC transporter ATP-binding protein [Methylocucumis oryzae]